MPFQPAEQSFSHNPRLQQASNSRIRPCYRDRQASISSQPGVFRAPVPSMTAVRQTPQKRHTTLPYTSRQATSTPSSPRVAAPRLATATATANAIERSDIRVLTDQLRSSPARRQSLSIVEIGGRSLPLTRENLDKFLRSFSIWDAHFEEVEFEGPAKDRLRTRVADWRNSVKLASRESVLRSPFSEFGT